ncbi:MAG: branched-chain-amino-acid transaminase [Phycisphaerae bacterium]|nr:branched-chain-amino-acid transaminase [Phycisphaerae bacterium]
MGLQVYLDGRLVEKEDAKVSVFDHGLLYGDGVFEGIRSYNGKVFELEAHIRRLYDSAKGIRLTIPLAPPAMIEAIHATLKANNLRDAYIRLVVTRGAGYLGLSPTKTSNPQVIIITDQIEMYPPEVYDRGLEIITCTTIRNHPNALSARIKSLNYLNNILAKIEAMDAGVLEAIMLNHEGFVAECTGDNVFIVRDGRLETPPTAAGILEGVTRAVVMELGRARGIEVIEKNLTRYDLYIADECFLTGTAAEVIPVTKIDGRTIGQGSAGPITRDLIAAFHDRTRNHNG